MLRTNVGIAITNAIDGNISGLAEGQILIWNAATKKWTNFAAPSTGGLATISYVDSSLVGATNRFIATLWGLGTNATFRSSDSNNLAMQLWGATNQRSNLLQFLDVNGNVLANFGPAGGLHIGGSSSAGQNNLLVDGGVTVTGGANITAALNVGGSTTFSNLTGSRPMLTDGGKAAVSGQIDLANANHVTGFTPIANGGTAASTAANARTNLSIAISNALDAKIISPADGDILTYNGALKQHTNGPPAVTTNYVQSVTNLMDRVRDYNPYFGRYRSRVATNATTKVMMFGDSETSQLAYSMFNRFGWSYGFAGFEGEPGATYGTSQWVYTNDDKVKVMLGDYTSWPFTYFIVTNGGNVAMFITNGAVFGMQGNIVGIDVLEENLAGGGKLQTNAGPGTAWADFQTGIIANNGGVQHGKAYRWTNSFMATSMMLRWTTTNGNPVKIVPVGVTQWPNRGTVMSMLALGGLDLTNFFKCPTNVTGPLMAARNPDLIIGQWLDNSWELAPTLPLFNTFMSNYLGGASVLKVGSVPILGTNAPDVPLQDVFWFSNAVVTGQSFFNCYTAFGDTNRGFAQGYLSAAADPHPTPAGDEYIADLIFGWAQFLTADGLMYGARRFWYQDGLGPTLTNDWVQIWEHGAGGDVQVLGLSGTVIKAPFGWNVVGPRFTHGFDVNGFNPTDQGFVSINGGFTCYQGSIFGSVNGGGTIYTPSVFATALWATNSFTNQGVSYLLGGTTLSSTSVTARAVTVTMPAAPNTNFVQGLNGTATIWGVNSNGVAFVQASNSPVQLPAGYVLFNMNADGSVTNITTTTNSLWGTGAIGSPVLTNGFFRDFGLNRDLHVWMRGNYFTGTTPVSTRLIVMLNSLTATNTLDSKLFAPTASKAADSFYIDLDLTCRSGGASGTIEMTGTMITLSAGAPTYQNFTNSLTTVDLTTALKVEVGFTNGAPTTSWQAKNGGIFLQ